MGLVWEAKNEIERDKALNQDFVALGGAELSRTIRSVIGTKTPVQKKHSYSLREDVPRVFKTEVMQQDE